MTDSIVPWQREKRADLCERELRPTTGKAGGSDSPGPVVYAAPPSVTSPLGSACAFASCCCLWIPRGSFPSNVDVAGALDSSAWRGATRKYECQGPLLVASHEKYGRWYSRFSCRIRGFLLKIRAGSRTRAFGRPSTVDVVRERGLGCGA